MRLDDSFSCLTQWDTGRKIILEENETCDQVHFSNKSFGTTIDVKTYQLGDDLIADIPDELLQSSATLIVHCFLTRESGETTTISKSFPVRPRNKPLGYIYNPNDQTRIKEFNEFVDDTITEITEIKDNVKATVVHQPIIQNGTWWVWSFDNNDYIDTGVEAQGPQGEQGIQGEKGIQGDKGDPALINGVNTITIKGGTNINLEQTGTELIINNTNKTIDVVQTTGQSEISVMSQKAITDKIELINDDLGDIQNLCGKEINGTFNGNNFTSSFILEAGTTYYILYKSGSKANFYTNKDTTKYTTVEEGGLYEFTPSITGMAKLFRNVIDDKNDIVFYIGTELSFFRNIRKNTSDIANAQVDIKENSDNISAVETSVNQLFVEKKLTETNDRSAITQTVSTGYYLGISVKVPKGTRVGKITFGDKLTKEPYILFVNANGLVVKKWAITSKTMYIGYTTEADGVFVYHIVGNASNFKWKSSVTDGSKNTLIPQYVSLHETEINVGDTLEQPNFKITAKVWADCEIEITELNYEVFKDNKYRGKKIAFLGDSITQGLTWNGSAQVYVEKPYPMTIAEKLNCECQNVGHSSYPISSIGKAQCFNTTYSEIALDTDYIFVFGGTNDYQYSVPVGTITDREDISFCGAVFTLINKIRTRNPNAKLVFFTPLHRSEEVKSDGVKLVDYVNAIRDVCELCSIPVVDLYKNSGFSNVVTEMQQYYADGLHLTQDGYNVLGNVISEKIRYI